MLVFRPKKRLNFYGFRDWIIGLISVRRIV